jgi:hypothetical protein
MYENNKITLTRVICIVKNVSDITDISIMDKSTMSIKTVIICGIITILLSIGGSVLLWAYTTEVKNLTIQAEVIAANCHRDGGTSVARKRTDICFTDFILTFTYNDILYTNVSVSDIPACGYFCYPPLPPNASVFINIANNNPYDVDVVDSADIHHYPAYNAGGIIVAVAAGISVCVFVAFAIRLFKDWRYRRSQLCDITRAPLMSDYV